MLIALSIRDIVIIDKLDIAFEAGLSALTGETGAGKSILLDSLSLALGGRGDAAATAVAGAASAAGCPRRFGCYCRKVRVGQRLSRPGARTLRRRSQ